MIDRGIQSLSGEWNFTSIRISEGFKFVKEVVKDFLNFIGSGELSAIGPC